MTETTILTFPNCPPVCEVDLKNSRWLANPAYPVVHLFIGRVLNRELYYTTINTFRKGSKVPLITLKTFDAGGIPIKEITFRDVTVTALNNTTPDVTLEFTYKHQ